MSQQQFDNFLRQERDQRIRALGRLGCAGPRAEPEPAPGRLQRQLDGSFGRRPQQPGVCDHEPPLSARSDRPAWRQIDEEVGSAEQTPLDHLVEPPVRGDSGHIQPLGSDRELDPDHVAGQVDLTVAGDRPASRRGGQTLECDQGVLDGHRAGEPGHGERGRGDRRCAILDPRLGTVRQATPAGLEHQPQARETRTSNG